MTRNTTTKFVATALAVASLGIAGSAQASEVEQGAGQASQTGQGIAIGEPTPGTTPGQAPGQGTGAQPTDPTNATKPQVDPEEVDYNSAAYFKSAQAKQRFERYCNMKDAEPSHSDKKFCEDYRKHHGASASGAENGKGPMPYPHPQKPGYEKPGYEKPGYEKPGYEKPGYEPAAEKAQEPSKGALPFTGLEIWQLGLLGIVLVGGGFGARRLLTS